MLEITVSIDRTQVTGITAEHLTGAESLPFAEVQQRVAQLIQDKIITGWVPSSLAHPFPSFPNTINPVPQQISLRKFLKLWCDLFRYCIWMDLSVLGLAHPNSQIRDVALFIPFRNALGSLDQIVRLPTMIWTLMGRRIGEYTHHPVRIRFLSWSRLIINILRVDGRRACCHGSISLGGTSVGGIR
jgi:hypothetical protein